MYKILLLAKDTKTQPLWTPYKVAQIVDGVEEFIDFETDDIIVLEDTIDELLFTHPRKTVKAIMDMDYVVDVIFESV